MNTEFKKIKIAVIGTGTAGCLQTLQFSQELNFEYFELDWIYDPETPIFGIGEATTPHIPQVLRKSKFSTDMLFNEFVHFIVNCFVSRGRFINICSVKFVFSVTRLFKPR